MTLDQLAHLLTVVEIILIVASIAQEKIKGRVQRS